MEDGLFINILLYKEICLTFTWCIENSKNMRETSLKEPLILLFLCANGNIYGLIFLHTIFEKPKSLYNWTITLSHNSYLWRGHSFHKQNKLAKRRQPESWLETWKRLGKLHREHHKTEYLILMVKKSYRKSYLKKESLNDCSRVCR